MRIDRLSYFDFRNDCRVVETTCFKCGHKYSEEVEAAKEKVSTRKLFACIDCDEGAEAVSVVAVVLRDGRQV